MHYIHNDIVRGDIKSSNFIICVHFPPPSCVCGRSRRISGRPWTPRWTWWTRPSWTASRRAPSTSSAFLASPSAATANTVRTCILLLKVGVGLNICLYSFLQICCFYFSNRKCMILFVIQKTKTCDNCFSRLLSIGKSNIKPVYHIILAYVFILLCLSFHLFGQRI